MHDHPAKLADVPDESEAARMRAFWSVYGPIREEMATRLRQSAASLPGFAPAALIGDNKLSKDAQSSAEAEEQALAHGNWTPLLEQLARQGKMFAEVGVEFSAWFELLSLFRADMRKVVWRVAKSDQDRALEVSDGLNRYVDLCLAKIGEAYLAAKELIIRRHQEAIRELSTPVLQVRDRLLIIPLVGMVDTLRARQLTDALLRAIRERRARAVVMDITGVPIVDSRVANHLVQACEAARLMGAHVIITGISSSIAQALVAIGAELKGISTLADLQTGLEEAQRVLASGER